ncbi:hypothetical protein, partial [Enterococcus hirae]|uniref:hypothetical protein n=1 Tax=Enterococcus hirae TaxID=1354 RepID=UPI0025542125
KMNKNYDNERKKKIGKKKKKYYKKNGKNKKKKKIVNELEKQKSGMMIKSFVLAKKNGKKLWQIPIKNLNLI